MRARAWAALVAAGAALLWTLPAGLAGQGRLDLRVSPSRVAFPTPGVEEFDQGHVRAEGVTVNVETRGFVLWVLTIRSEDPDLGGYGKPLSDLQWRQPDDGWQPMGTSEEVVAIGFTSRQVDLDFRTLLAWEHDAPDSYGAGITLRLSSLFGGGAGLRAYPSGEGVPPGDPEEVCARIAVETAGRRTLESSSGADRIPAAQLERQCLDRVRDRVEVGWDDAGRDGSGAASSSADRRGPGR